MPTQTFDNLAESKRSRLVAIALEEFAEHDFDSASVSKVVARAGIAKGSVYQYFHDKRDLYLYLVQQSERALMSEVSGSAPADTTDFFDLVRWQMSASIRAAAAHPTEARLLQRAYRADAPFSDEVRELAAATSRDHFLALLRSAAQRGEIDGALDLEVAAYLIQAATAELGRFLHRRLNLSTADEDPARFATDEAERVFDQIIDILRHGLGPARRS